jgi:peptide chain release factor 2
MATVFERVAALKAALKIDELKARLEETRTLTSASDLWDDPQRAAQLTQQQSRDEALLKKYDDLAALADGTSEDEILELAGDDLAELEKQALLAGEYDQRAAILAIHAGAGGTDAQDWAQMLLRMYQRYVERAKGETDALIDRSDWSVEILDSSAGEEAGLKSVTVAIKGNCAYGLLKGEAGVHRLVRQSPFNAAKLRQTSFAMVDVMPQVDSTDHLELDEKELRVDVYRASGKGGQGVNTTDSAVRVTHIPTGLVVAIQNERSQLQNKATAMSILAARLLQLKQREEEAAVAKMRGEVPSNEWGSQIRSYVLHPYKMVKDHRTDLERTDVDAVLDGDIGPFTTAYLNWQASKKS